MLLEIKNLDTGYGKRQVLKNISMVLPEEKITAIIGPNGSGKTTVLKTICGMLPIWKGTVIFDGISLNGSSPAKNLKKGISFVSQGNRVFDELTVLENLEIGGRFLKKSLLKHRIEETVILFSDLRDRLKQCAGQLSGGEQQQLAIARAFITRPKLLILDEPSLGLSPSFIKNVFQKIEQKSREDKTTIMIVEQKVKEVLQICHKVYALKLGRVAFEGGPNELMENNDKLKELFL